MSSRTRIKTLAYETILDNCRFFNNDLSAVPRMALTVGVQTVMDAREVVLVVTGQNKALALSQMIEGGVNHMVSSYSLFSREELTRCRLRRAHCNRILGRWSFASESSLSQMSPSTADSTVRTRQTSSELKRSNTSNRSKRSRTRSSQSTERLLLSEWASRGRRPLRPEERSWSFREVASFGLADFPFGQGCATWYACVIHHILLISWTQIRDDSR